MTRVDDSIGETMQEVPDMERMHHARPMHGHCTMFISRMRLFLPPWEFGAEIPCEAKNAALQRSLSQRPIVCPCGLFQVADQVWEVWEVWETDGHGCFEKSLLDQATIQEVVG